MRVLYVAIDIGIVCLALAWLYVTCFESSTGALLTHDTIAPPIEDIRLVNLTKVERWHHNEFDYTYSTCPLGHSANLHHRVEHFLDLYKSIVDAAKIIFVEYQPPQGHKAVEQLIFSKYGHKIIFIYPRSLQKAYMMQTLDYKQRKVHAVEIASNFAMTEKCKSEFDKLKATKDDENIRAHDVADAMLILLHGIRKHGPKKQPLLAKPEFFKQFEYKDTRSRSSFLSRGL